MHLTFRRLLRIWCASICFLLPHGSCLGQSASVDVCAYFTGTTGPWWPRFDYGNGTLVCDGVNQLSFSPTSASFAGPTVRLLITLVAQSASQEANLVKLREELALTTEALTKAVEALDAASKETSKKNAKWRDEALQKNLDAIANVPVQLAGNEALRRAIAAALASDTEFLGEIKKAIK